MSSRFTFRSLAAGCRLALGAALLTLGLAASSPAAISGLYNTGVDNFGIPLPSLSQEIHYKLIASADPNCPISHPPRVEGFPGTWVGTNNLVSEWIRPEQLGGVWFPPFNNYGNCGNGQYVYSTTFTATGAGNTITGRVAADDQEVDIQLNGTSVGTTGANFAVYGPNFTISGIGPGTHTLDFFVNNLGGAPTGLRVEYVPEPSTFALAGIAAAISLAAYRRRRQAA